MEGSLRLCVAILIGALIWSSTAKAETTALMKVLENYRTSSGEVDWAKVKQDANAQEQQEKSKPVAAAPKPPAPKVTFLLRQNFSDIHLFEDPTKVAEAKGASFSWTDDRVGDDRAWSANGMAAVAYSLPGDFAKKPGETAIMGVSFVPYVQLNRETHSKLTKKNSDVQTYGGSFELGLDTWTPGEHFQNYVRLSGSSVNDQVADTENFHSIAEWLPVYKFTKNVCVGVVCGAIPVSQLGSGPQVLYKFDPELKAIYDRTSDDNAPIFFSNKPEAFRIGPEVTLLMKLFGPEAVICDDYIDLAKFLFKATYYWNVETFSDRDFSWFDTSLTYNIGDGHLGLTLSYQNGYLEVTGAQTDLTKISLTGKF
jgi:hypothetical protein